eukprot:363193-Chlamydomonas_euryale.AAC.17
MENPRARQLAGGAVRSRVRAPYGRRFWRMIDVLRARLSLQECRRMLTAVPADRTYQAVALWRPPTRHQQGAD